MIYKKIVRGTFIKRPNRFIAHVLIDDEEEIVHVKNTGRCKELLIPGASLILEDCSHNKNRKTRYSIIAVWKENTLINMDSQVPNKVVLDAINNNLIAEFQDVKKLKGEVTYTNSRFDIFFKNKGIPTFLEVKGVTLQDNKVSMFPDAPTKRGHKHILEMIDATENGYNGVIFFLIQMKGPKILKPNWKMDPEFSKALLMAKNKGVKILAYDSIVTENSISIGTRVPINLSKT